MAAVVAARRSAAVPTLALGAFAWVLLVVSDASGWGRYLHHDGIADAGFTASTSVAVFVAGWVVMLTAMMLPTTYPLVTLFASFVRERSDRRALIARLLGGYLAVWTFAGLVAFAGDIVVHGVVDAVPAVEREAWVLGAAVFAAAGAYQLSSLKERCLLRCRNPRTVLLLKWRGVEPAREAFGIGTSHGAACLSCCWALMLVMFAVGAGSLGWMLGLGSVMAAEKTLRGGARLRVPIGAILLVAAALAVVVGL